MENLKKFLGENKKKEFNSLYDKSISEVTGLNGYSNIKDILTKYDINITWQVFNFNKHILWLINYENVYNKYK